MNTHTPGPWVIMTRPEIDAERLGDGSIIGGPTGRDEYDPTQGVIALADLREAAEQGVEPWPICKPELEADARLISLAPDLLAAAERVLAKLAEYHADPGALYPEDLLALIGELLPPLVARAKGES